jgi:hypothetical protein
MKHVVVLAIILFASLSFAGEKMPTDKKLYHSPRTILDILGVSNLSGVEMSCKKCGSAKFHYLGLRKNGYWQNPPEALIPESDDYNITHYGLICSKCSKKYLVQIQQVYYERGATKYIKLKKPQFYSE